MKYRKKPLVVEAMMFKRETYDKLREFTGRKASRLAIPKCPDGKAVCYIETLEGDKTATEGDYIIKGVQDEFYPCKPDIFEETYERVDENVHEQTGFAFMGDHGPIKHYEGYREG